MAELPDIQGKSPSSAYPTSQTGRLHMQVAALVNCITHMLAGRQTHWPVLDALHQHFHERLLSIADDASVPFMERRKLFDKSLQELVAPSASLSACARAYYIDRAVSHIASEGCTFLIAVAAAAHCDGGCSEACATRIKVAVLPAIATSWAAKALVPLSALRFQRLATRIASGHLAPGTGAGGCGCRAALCASFATRSCWHPPLLESAGPTDAFDVALQESDCPGRRCVIAQVCSAGQDVRQAGLAGVHIRTPLQPCGARGLFLHPQICPCRKRFRLGCIRRSARVLAALHVEAGNWVQSDAEWDAALVSGFHEDSVLVHDWLARSFDGSTGWGTTALLSAERLAKLGYADPASDSLLVFAAVEDMPQDALVQ